MKLPCAVIQDLLPLYAEDLTSDVSKTLVEEHLPECEDCRNNLEDLRKDRPVPALSDAVPLQLVKTALRRNTVAWALVTACAVALIALVLMAWITRPQPVPYDFENLRFWNDSDGVLQVRLLGPTVQYIRFSAQHYTDGEGRQCVEITAYTSPWLQLLGEDSRSIWYPITDRKVDAVYYCDQSEGGRLYRVRGSYTVGEEFRGASLPRLALNVYFLAALLLTGLFALLALLLRKGAHGQTLGYVALGFGCYVAAHLLIKGGDGSSFFLLQDLAFLLLTTAALFGLCLGALLLRSLRKTF